MHAPSTFAVMSALAGSAIAQSTTVVDLYLYGYEGDDIAASVVDVSPQATTYLVSCPPGTDSNDCGLGAGMTLVQGPSTIGVHYTEQDVITLDLNCDVESSTATCTESDVAYVYETDTDTAYSGILSTTTTYELTDITDSLEPVTVTAGVSLLSDSTATATGSNTEATGASTGASATGTTATKTSTSESSSGTATSKTSSSGTGSSASATSTAVLGAANSAGMNVMLAGVAGAVGVAMAL